MTGAQILTPDIEIALVYFLKYYAVSVTKVLKGFLEDFKLTAIESNIFHPGIFWVDRWLL